MRFIVLLIVAWFGCSSQLVRAEVTSEQVNRAMAGGVKYLKETQSKVDGSWSDSAAWPAGGMTALSALALLSCGETAKSPEVSKALSYLEGLGPPTSVYVTSLQTMVFCAADPKKYQVLIGRNAKWLEASQVRDGETKGGWNYSGNTQSADESNTQFAMLALYEAERIGVRIGDQTWRLAQTYWLTKQRPDGAWGYRGGPPTGSMTCAGIASLVIAEGRLHSGDARADGDSIRCCGQVENPTNAIDRGLHWLGQKFSVANNPGAGGVDQWRLYYLYAVERVGRLTGQRFLGRHDWYREGAETFVAEQDRLKSYWQGSGHEASSPALSTSLVLLYLSKGRRPVVVSKLKYGEDSNWDLHRGGVPNLTRRIEQRWKRDLSWQTIDVQAATVSDLRESPILFISGRAGLPLSRESKENLKHYVEQGGFIFAEACDGNGCDGKEFDRQFRALMQELFPQSALRLLPADHPVWYAEEKVDPKFMRPLYGLDACCRTAVVYCPQNLSCYWSLKQFERKTDLPEKVEQELDAVLRIGVNVVTYATNRELKEKLDRPQALVSVGNDQLTRGTLFVPKLQHAGGSDDAPNALGNLLAVLGQQTKLSVQLERRLFSPSDEKLLDFPLVFMHGRRAFRWTAAERKGLATFLQRGGFLFADSICASQQFADSFREEMLAMFPTTKLVRIPVTHPMFSAEFHGFDLNKVSLRDPQTRGADDPLNARLTVTQPHLEGLEIDGRWAVIFSPYDLSCALENASSLDCKGYIKQDAARIGTNIVLYALQQ